MMCQCCDVLQVDIWPGGLLGVEMMEDEDEDNWDIHKIE